MILEIGERMFGLIQDEKLSEYEAWNASSVALIEIAKVSSHIHFCFFQNNNESEPISPVSPRRWRT